MPSQGSSLNFEQLKEKLKWVWLGNIGVFLNYKLVFTSSPQCAILKINEPVIYMDMDRDYSVSSMGKAVLIHVNNHSNLISQFRFEIYNQPDPINYHVKVVPRPIHIELRPMELNDIEKHSMELLIIPKGSRHRCSSYVTNTRKYDQRIKLPLGKDEVFIYVFGGEECIEIHSPKCEEIDKCVATMDLHSEITHCIGELKQILKAPKEYRDPELLTQKTESL